MHKGAQVEVFEALLHHDDSRNTLVERNKHGLNVLELALEWEQSFEVIEFLLDKMPPSSLYDPRVDWSKAMRRLHSCHPKFTRLFLQKTLRKRLDHLGLTQWKQNILEMMNGMVECYDSAEAPEDDLGTSWRVCQVKKVYVELLKYELMEATSLVELALWKIKCLSGFKTASGHRAFDSMEDITVFAQKDTDFVATDYIRECRITCSADSAIPNIISFLK